MIPVKFVYKKPLFLGVSTEQITADAVQRLRDTPLIFQNSQSKLRLTSSGGEERTVSTINDLHAAEQDGYSAATTLDMGVEAYFKLVSSLLSVLTLAQPSKLSHLQSISSATLLPARHVSLFQNADDQSDKQQELKHSQVTIAQLAAQGVCKIITSEPGVLTVEGQVTSTLTEVLRGDLDSDGLEDMFVWQRSRVVGGTMHWSTTMVLTRLDDAGLFSDVRLPIDG